MSAKRVLISCPLIHDSIEGFRERFETHGIEYDVPDVDQHLTEEELLDVIDRYDGVLAGDDEFTEDVFAATDRLRIVVKWGIGTDNIDVESAQRNGVTVTNTPGAFAPEVADVAIGYAIMLTRKLHAIDREVRKGNWSCPRGVSLRARSFGVVGVGSIGSETVRRASAHGMDVVGYDVVPLDQDLKEATGVTSVDADDLFERSDIVSLHCPLTPETERMVGRQELDAIGEDGYLINTARGGLVDQDALVAALEDGSIGGAALDVFEEEPLPPTSPLVEFDNVILGSHNAQNTEEAVASVNRRAVQKLIESLGGGH